MLQLIYVLAFTVIAFLTVSNLIRSLITVSMDSQRRYPTSGKSPGRRGASYQSANKTLHPELFDKNGKLIDEPLLVVHSVSVEDARQKLDALYNASPSKPRDTEENSEL
jgi:hypothetical protein